MKKLLGEKHEDSSQITHHTLPNNDEALTQLIYQKAKPTSILSKIRNNLNFIRPQQKLEKKKDFDDIIFQDIKKDQQEFIQTKTADLQITDADLILKDKQEEEEKRVRKVKEDEDRRKKREETRARDELESKRYKAKEEEVIRLENEGEGKKFELWNMIKYGNPFLNILFVDSLLFPRHARWTLIFVSIMLIWFFCAIIYNNTKNPLDVPDFSQKASRLALQDLWISLIAPIGSIIMMYLFYALFRISDQRIKYATNLASVKEMINELNREMGLRFLMAYFIAFSMFCAVSYYVLQFTSSFGWKTSWAWFFSSCGAVILNFFIYDILISLLNWLVYRIYKPLGRFFQDLRSVKQAREEV